MSEKKYTSSTLDCILSHRSIRHFTPEPIEEKVIEQLVNAARFASTSNHLQCVSIVRITDPALREQMMVYSSNQEYVKSAPEFWVFCVDFHKHKQIRLSSRERLAAFGLWFMVGSGSFNARGCVWRSSARWIPVLCRKTCCWRRKV